MVTGNLPVDLALTVAAVVLALLYMPKAQELDSPLLQVRLPAGVWRGRSCANAHRGLHCSSSHTRTGPACSALQRTAALAPPPQPSRIVWPSSARPLLQEFLQEFSWTQAAMPADLERRNQQLAASEAATSQLAGKKVCRRERAY